MLFPGHVESIAHALDIAGRWVARALWALLRIAPS